MSPGMEFHRTETVVTVTGRFVGVEVAAVARYEAETGEAIRALKYRGRTRAARVLADTLAPFARQILDDDDHDRPWTVTWAPTSERRRRDRGYDQAELLARHLAASVGVRHRRLLRRISRGHQTGSRREERLTGPTFVSRPRVEGAVIVVDDVTTTGATFKVAARVLAEAGAARVVCLAVAWTPDRSEPSVESDAAGLGDRL